jgi:hypothetical protein
MIHALNSEKYQKILWPATRFSHPQGFSPEELRLSKYNIYFWMKMSTRTINLLKLKPNDHYDIQLLLYTM